MSVSKREFKEFLSQRKELLEGIKRALMDIEAAESFFQNAEEPKLIEVAIYNKQAVLKNYEYLLKEAKALNISLSPKDLIELRAIIVEV